MICISQLRSLSLVTFSQALASDYLGSDLSNSLQTCSFNSLLDVFHVPYTLSFSYFSACVCERHACAMMQSLWRPEDPPPPNSSSYHLVGSPGSNLDYQAFTRGPSTRWVLSPTPSSYSKCLNTHNISKDPYSSYSLKTTIRLGAEARNLGIGLASFLSLLHPVNSKVPLFLHQSPPPPSMVHFFSGPLTQLQMISAWTIASGLLAGGPP